MTPATDQSRPVGSSSNVTYVCNVTQEEPGEVERRAIWEVEGRQIQSGNNPVRDAFESSGIFIEQVEVGLVNLIVTREARLQYLELGVMVRCTAFTPTDPPLTEFGPFLFVRTYGKF